MIPSILLQADVLETDFGVVILEELTGETLTHKGQKIRLFDRTRKSAEVFYPAGYHGKPAIHNHATGEQWYPLNAYSDYHGVTWKQAVKQLSERFLTEGIAADIVRRARQQQEQEKNPKLQQPPSLHDPSEVARSCNPKHYQQNNFARYLRRLLGADAADEALQRFPVGTTTWHFRGTVFWQQDAEGEYRAGKIIAYTEPTGKRRQEDEYRPRWAHEVQRLPDFHVVQCLFGEHQLVNRPGDPVGIVESEKTAILLSVLLPETIWLATGGSQNLGLIERCPALTTRIITLWPDLDPRFKFYDLWEKKAAQLLGKGFDVQVSQLLRQTSTVANRQDKMDVADFLAGPQDRCPETGRLLTFTPAPGTPSPSIVTSIADQLANPGSILKPDESQLERLPVEPDSEYLVECDDSSPAYEEPTLKPLTFHQWQQKNPAFDQMGMASLSTKSVNTNVND